MAETNIQEMLLKIMSKMDKFEQRLEQDRVDTKQQFQNMEAQFQEIRKDREQDRAETKQQLQNMEKI
jgi:ferritin-like metal-binding protein YciE